MRKTRVPLVMLLIGAVLIGLAVYGSWASTTGRAAAERDVAELRRQLDSVRASLVTASTAADSARVRAAITDREYYLGRREYHLAPRSSSRRPGLVLGGAGGMLLLAGGIMLWRGRRMSGN